MDPAPSDRAERHLFAALPELDAVPRRGLALALAGVPRAGIASELGLSGAALSAELAAGRKALRRTRVELGSGGRCERAERALSDRLDGALSELDERFLDAHLARCSRCRTHESELTAAVEELRADFAALEASPEPRAVEPAPEPRAVEPAPEPPAVEPAPPRARLRVVPPAPLLPPAPERPALDAPPDPPAPLPPAEPPPAIEVAAVEPPPAAEPPAAAEPPPAAQPPPAANLPAPRRPAAVARHQRIRAALPIAVAALIAVGLVAAAIALLSALGADENLRAPWDGPDAPVVHPAPISGQ